MLTKNKIYYTAKLSKLIYKVDKIKDYYEGDKRYTTNSTFNILQRLTNKPIIIKKELYVCRTMICDFDDYRIIIFSGLDYTNFNDITNTVIRCSLEPFPVPGLQAKNYPNVHGGCGKQFMSIVDNLTEVIDNSPIKKVIFGGHSKGGALATCAAMYYSCVREDMEFGCVTFGSNIIADDIFVSIFDNNIKDENTHRYRLKNDLIPYSPYDFFGEYCHVKGIKWLDFNKRVIANTNDEMAWGYCALDNIRDMFDGKDFFKNIGHNHTMDSYIKGIKSYYTNMK